MKIIRILFFLTVLPLSLIAQKQEDKYNKKGLLIERIRYRDSWKQNKDSLQPNEKFIYDYDEAGNITRKEVYRVPYGMDYWEGEEKNLAGYDSQNRKVYDESFEWNNENKDWDNKRKRITTYSSNGKISSNCLYAWKYGEMAGVFKDSTSYDRENRIAMHIEYKWNYSSQDWNVDEKTEYEYTDETITKINFSRIKNEWVLSFTEVSRKDKKMKERREYSWKEDLQSRVETCRSKEYIFNDSLISEEKYFYDDDLKALKGYSKCIRLIDEFSAKDNREMQIRCTWDQHKNDWVYVTRYTKWDRKSTYEKLDHYNETTEEWENYKILETSGFKTLLLWQNGKWENFRRVIDHYPRKKVFLWDRVTDRWEPLDMEDREEAEKYYREWLETRYKGEILTDWNDYDPFTLFIFSYDIERGK